MNIEDLDIERLISDTKPPSRAELTAILARAEACEGLSIEDATQLTLVKETTDLELINTAAYAVKQKLFGNRVVLFAPLYLSNHCTNGCLYCGFRNANKELPRKALTPEEVVKEARVLEAMGLRRILLVTGEDSAFDVDYIVSCVEAIYKETSVRIVHVNAPPVEVEELKKLKAAGIGVYQVFQETYHRGTYKVMHPSGKKRDYAYRLLAMDRAMEAGIADVGIGTLLGLYDWRFDVLSTINHSKRLKEKYGTHAHTVSIPRLRPTMNSALDIETTERYAVSDRELKQIAAIYRLTLPTAGIVATTREPADIRSALLKVGVSQLSAASSTEPGGYSGKEEKTLAQFETIDPQTLDEVMAMIVKDNEMPSLCTTCYRTGRVGKDFGETTTSGDMEKFCRANAILTLKEYTLEQCLNGTAELFDKTIKAALEEITDDKLKTVIEEKLDALANGARDLYL